MPNAQCLTPNALVIGYGNPLRRDDGLGWVAAERVAEGMGPTVEVLTDHQLTPEMAEAASRVRLVVFVDAREGAVPGEVQCDPVLPGESAAAMSHDLDPPAILAAAKELYGGSPRGVTVSITGADFGYGEGLSPLIEAAIPSLVERITGLIEEMDHA